MKQTVEIDLGERKIELETGHWAKQAGGSVLVRSGETVVLVTATAADEPRAGIDFFPLTCDYREYTYSAGRFPGGYIKREGRPTEKEVLTSRLIDRPIRPLFPDGFKNETQIIAFVLSADPKFDPSSLALVGAGAALAISDIPFLTTLAAVRVGHVDDQWVINPTYDDVERGKLNIVVAAAEAGIVMVEAEAAEVSEATVLEAIECGSPNQFQSRRQAAPEAFGRQRTSRGPIRAIRSGAPRAHGPQSPLRSHSCGTVPASSAGPD